MRAEDLKQIILNHLPDAEVYIDTNDEVHFNAIVISASFANISKVAQQQLVYAGLNHYIQSGAVHALALKTYTPELWSEMKQSHG